MTKILIIDDEIPTLDMLQLFLEACGYTVLAAENATTKDGFSVLKKIKSIRPETEVIVITGHGDKDLAQQAFELNASEFFNKPLDTDALNAALKRAEKRLGLIKID